MKKISKIDFIEELKKASMNKNTNYTFIMSDGEKITGKILDVRHFKIFLKVINKKHFSYIEKGLLYTQISKYYDEDEFKFSGIQVGFINEGCTR